MTPRGEKGEKESQGTEKRISEKGERMAEWVSHLIVADRVLEKLPWLTRHEFCVGNIAPDCNLPNEDWSDWVPSR